MHGFQTPSPAQPADTALSCVFTQSAAFYWLCQFISLRCQLNTVPEKPPAKSLLTYITHSMRVKIRGPVGFLSHFLFFFPPLYFTLSFNWIYSLCLHNTLTLQTCRPVTNIPKQLDGEGRQGRQRQARELHAGQGMAMHTQVLGSTGSGAPRWVSRNTTSLLNLCIMHKSYTWNHHLRPHCPPAPGRCDKSRSQTTTSLYLTI